MDKSIKENKILVYSLTTSYAESSLSKRSHFVHVLNMELVKLGIKVKTITPHIADSLKTETRDGVCIKRFRYLPEKYQINLLSIPEADIYLKNIKLIYYQYQKLLNQKLESLRFF